MREYFVYDVFTDRAFGGNPLAVVPDATGLGDDDLMRLTREFNLAETAFVFPPESPDHTARVRIFTVVEELPFAGHPVVGTAVALRHMGRGGDRMVLDLGIGPLEVTTRDGYARFTTRVPLRVGDPVDTATVAGLLGLRGESLRTDRHPPVVAGVGNPIILAELARADALSAIAPDFSAFRARAAETRAAVSVYAYLREDTAIRARLFSTHFLGLEDPATGSAAASLAAFLGRLDGHSQYLSITQGVDMGRPSLIEAAVEVAGGDPVAVTVGGQAVRVMQGQLTV